MRCLTLFFWLCFGGLYAQDSTCIREVPFGDVTICLPKMVGMQECYQDPAIKLLADATEMETNEILGYYLAAEEYATFKPVNNDGFKEFFKVYGVTQVNRFPAGVEEVNMLYSIMVEQFGDTTLLTQQMVDEAQERIGEEVQIGVPRMLQRYQLSDESFTLIALITYRAEEEITMVMSLNGAILNGRFVNMAYYRLYEDANSITLLRDRSNKTLQQLLSLN